jgi:GDP-L-fucose synthase
MDSASSIFVAGHNGLVGSAISRCLVRKGYTNLILRTRQELDLRNQAEVHEFFKSTRPDYVFLAAAKVGGILANSSYPADFLRDNIDIQSNVIDAAYRSGVKKLQFLGSSCIYPKLAPQPLREEYILTGELEPTNEWYAIAKIAGIKMAQAYTKQFGFRAISLMPTNLYGPGDNYDLQSSHVLPALIRKFHDAKVNGAAEVVLWGTGSPLREFLHVDDLAQAAVFLMLNYEDPQIINVGSGAEVTIRELAEMISEIIGYEGRIGFDPSHPDGTPRKLLDMSKITALGWKPARTLRTGIEQTYQAYLQNRPQERTTVALSS